VGFSVNSWKFWRFFGAVSVLFGPDSMLFGAESVLFGAESVLFGAESVLFGPDWRFLLLFSKSINNN
jgi:hypothetical protein